MKVAIVALALVAFGCDAADPDMDGGLGEEGGSPMTDGGTPSAECSGWTILEDMHPGVTLDSLGVCTSAAGVAIAESLMNFDGAEATGDNGAAPCVEVLCDADFAYIASNALPHYTPVADPIFETVATPIVHRIPLNPAPIDQSTPSDSFEGVNGCDSALSMAVVNETPALPPFSHCWYQTEDGTQNTGLQTITDEDGYIYSKIHCYGPTAGVITGIPAFAPCEEARPDPYGSPLFSTYSDDAFSRPFVDFCGTHPAAITHNHWVNEACLAQDEEGAPENGYASGATAFVVEDLDAPDCAAESNIVGWAYDGNPMHGSCVCMERDDSGACTDLRRARSSYVYAGLARFADDTSALDNVDTATVEASYFGSELDECTTSEECCDGVTGVCRLYCHPLLVEDGDDVVLANRCVSPDYTWCTHAYNAHDDVLEDEGYVYLDRCNGVTTADGYTYVGTSTFPYVNSCFRDAPTASATDDTYIYLDAGGGPGGPPGGGPPGG
ncbi:MAG: YHYH protein [Sandaracinaceae bacterium]